MDFKRILVPIDYSSGSTEALAVALNHFKNSHIFLLHVIDLDQDEYVLRDEAGRDYQKKALEKSYDKLLDLVKAATELKYDAEPLVTFGRPAHGILEAAEKHDIDLIVMGSHGVTSFTKTFFGRTAYHVSRKAKCSIWMIKGKSTLG